MLVNLVSSPDLIWCFQYNLRAILKAIRAGVGIGSGTEADAHPALTVYTHYATLSGYAQEHKLHFTSTML